MMHDDDGTRYVVMVCAHGVDRVHTVYRDVDPARTEAARLRACGFEARVAEGRPPPEAPQPRWSKRGRRS